MPDRKSHFVLSASLLFAIFLWGGNNSGTKFIVGSWPPIWTGGSRFLCAGLLLLGILRWTDWLGKGTPLTPQLSRQLWWRGGASLAAYIVVFNTALRFTAASHVALYLGASPVWALVWEGRPVWNWTMARRYGAALLALGGVMVLFWPALGQSNGNWRGEVLGLAASILWTNYGRQCRTLGCYLSGVEASAHTMWRAGLILMPLALVEIWSGSSLAWRLDLCLVQAYCIICGGVVAFAIWSQALRHWPASQVLLFNNLIPLSTMSWARVWLGESITPTFWVAMLLILGGVFVGQGNWPKLGWNRMVPAE